MDQKPKGNPLIFTIFCCVFTTLSFTVGSSNPSMKWGFLFAALLFGLAGVMGAIRAERPKANP